VPTLIFTPKVKCHALADLTISFCASFLPAPTDSLAAVEQRSPAQRSGAEAARHPFDPLNSGAPS
jgi:hypothetical protein